MWRVVVCDQETSKTRRLSPLPGCENTTTGGCNASKTNTKSSSLIYFLEGKENHNLGTGIFVHHRILSAVKTKKCFSIIV
jgi:hypothetical protein